MKQNICVCVCVLAVSLPCITGMSCFYKPYSSQAPSFTTLDYAFDPDHDYHGQSTDYLLNNLPQQQQQQELSFADVMHFANFGAQPAFNRAAISDEGGNSQPGIDPVYFLKFPVLNDKENTDNLVVAEPSLVGDDPQKNDVANPSGSEPYNSKNTRKRRRSVKTSEEVESQRMTHIAVERNRRKQMNEHLRVLRSLMPGSYVQRGHQASIIGGAIEFVRELEQLLQCLESQRRRRLLPEQTPGPADSSPAGNYPPLIDFEGGGGPAEETAENKSCLADVEVRLLGFDATIKILSHRRPGQLIRAIAALEEMQLNILHTNVTTVEQTVLYSFNVKVTSESRFSADEIASSVQQIFSFIHANTAM